MNGSRHSDNDALEQLRLTARDFARTEVLPVANRLDPVGGSMPPELLDKMAEIGFFGILIPSEHGGLGLGTLEYCIIAEELARAWMSVASVIARANILPRSLPYEQAKRFLPRAARGEFLGAFALSEPDVGSDASRIRCHARRTSNGWLINGQKMWVTFADQADYLLVFARTDMSGAEGVHGISCFLVPKDRGVFPAGITGTPIKKIGYRGWKTWELSFQDVEVPDEALIGGEGEGFVAAMQTLDVARVHTAARAIGLARAGLEDAIAYSRSRVQFGRPIAEFQVTRFKIATMATRIEACRQLMYYACSKLDAGMEARVEASMAKYLSSEMAESVTSEALQIHGGAGYTTDFQVERHWRDARLTKIIEGTSEIQQIVIADSLLGRSR